MVVIGEQSFWLGQQVLGRLRLLVLGEVPLPLFHEQTFTLRLTALLHLRLLLMAGEQLGTGVSEQVSTWPCRFLCRKLRKHVIN